MYISSSSTTSDQYISPHHQTEYEDELHPTSYEDYFAGSFRLHAVGILGGIIWGIGNLFSLLATEKAGAAISYGLGQGATMVAAFWGVFIWKEFVGGPKINRTLLTCMFILFLSGIGLIIYAGL